MPGFALVCGVGIGIQVVGIDLERHQIQGRKAVRLDDRHVVGGSDGGAGHVGAGTRSQVGHAGFDSLSNRRHEPALLQLGQEPKRIAAADEDSLGLAYGRDRIVRLMGRVELEPHLPKALSGLLRIGVAIEQCVGYKQDPPSLSEECQDFRFAVLQVAGAVNFRAADE